MRRLRHWIANRGWKGTFLEAWRLLKVKLRRKRSGAEPAAETAVAAAPPPEVHPFDQRYGVESGGLIWGERLRSEEKGGYWATGYYGISPSVLWQAFDRLALDWPSFTFIDIGCGKGRALMLALKYPFRRVLGVELSAELANLARENLERFRADWRQEVPAEAIAGDATNVELPAGPLLLYLYHPFAAPVMIPFLKHVHEAMARKPREIYLVYINPELDTLLGRSAFLEKLWKECFPLLGEDAGADRFGSRQEYVSVYRFVG